MAPRTLSGAGVPVDKSYYANEEPQITHAVIELTNHSQEPVHFSVRRVSCHIGDDVFPIDHFFVYQLPDYDELNPESIELQPQVTVQYEVSFQQRAAAPVVSQPIKIAVELDKQGEALTLYSPFTLTRRTARR